MRKDVKVVKVVLYIIIILTFINAILLISKKSYALFKNNFSTGIKININTPDKFQAGYDKLMNKALEKRCLDDEYPPIIYNSDKGIYYFSGDNECIDFNYVWYSGKLWRIVSVYENGMMKLVTEDTLSAISFGDSIQYSNTSWVYQWLNEDFKNTLHNYQNVIVKNADWNACVIVDDDLEVLPQTSIPAKNVKGDIGLLDAYDYYTSMNLLTDYTKNYLFESASKNGFWLLNSNGSTLWVIATNGTYWTAGLDVAVGVRPSIYLKPSISLFGEGTLNNPFRIPGDKKTGKSGEKINTRLSGEYIEIENVLYRIVGVEKNGTTKLVKHQIIRDEQGGMVQLAFSPTFQTNYLASVTSNNPYYVGYYLNNKWLTPTLKKYLVEGTHYMGTVPVQSSYKNSICASLNTSETVDNCTKTSNIWTGYVGLPRYGEMFSNQGNEESFSMNPLDNKNEWIIASGMAMNLDVSQYTFTSRPTFYLNSNVYIKEGKGTEQNPYKIDL